MWSKTVLETVFFVEDRSVSKLITTQRLRSILVHQGVNEPMDRPGLASVDPVGKIKGFSQRDEKERDLMPGGAFLWRGYGGVGARPCAGDPVPLVPARGRRCS